MARKTRVARKGRRAKRSRGTAAPARRRREERLQGPPPREATLMRGDRERQAMERVARRRETSPKLSGGDVDANWERADSVGEEAVGGTVATPDQSVVDELGEALGVPRAPDEALRTSQEILEARDRARWKAAS